MKELKASQVFIPNAFPVHTYVEREDTRLEDDLRDALESPGQVISISGPSKSGKTVLVERVVGQDALIPVTGAGVDDPAELWDRVLDWFGAPSETTTTTGASLAAGVSAEAKGSVGVPFIGKGEAGGGGKVEGGVSRERSSVQVRRGLAQVIKEIAESDFVVLVDDFHYMPRAGQAEVAKQIKEAARQGVKIITASVPHRSDDVVRANPELRGRVLALDLDYWEDSPLRLIAERGLELLRVDIDRNSVDHFVREAAGSPQLMQGICLNVCRELGFGSTQEELVAQELSKDERRRIFERTAATTDYRSLVGVLDSGPKTRGVERKMYRFTDGTTGDVYRCILKGVALDPPALTFSYDELLRRVREACAGDTPIGSSVIGSVAQMCRLAEDKFPQERVIDWDDERQILDVSDPYLLFYLRWSDHLEG